MTKILALDQSTSKTGFAVSLDGEYQKSGVITTPNAQSKDGRAADYQIGAIESIIDEEQPSAVSLEEVHLGPNVQALIKLAEFRGRLIQLCLSKKLAVISISSPDMKHFLKFGFKVKRELKKQRARFTATAIVKGETEAMMNEASWLPEDEADAICQLQIAQAKFQQHLLMLSSDLPQYNRSNIIG